MSMGFEKYGVARKFTGIEATYRASVSLTGARSVIDRTYLTLKTGAV
jgi:hypothetical protein